MKILSGLLTLTLLVVTLNHCFAYSPHQVLLRVRTGADRNGNPLCVGAILHANYILTTGSCLYFQGPDGRPTEQIQTSLLSVTAGNDSVQAGGKVVRNVVSVSFAPGFNGTTMVNDLAFVKLNESLPLDNRTDMKWVSLDQDGRHSQHCFTSFYNVSGSSRFNSAEVTTIVPESECAKFGNYTTEKRADICSSYTLPPFTMCSITDSALDNSVDRGTPLLCDNKLVGLLSVIIPPNVTRPLDCSQTRRLDAYYAPIANHSQWIRSSIMDGNKASSSGHEGGGSSFMPPIPVPIPIPIGGFGGGQQPGEQYPPGQFPNGTSTGNFTHPGGQFPNGTFAGNSTYQPGGASSGNFSHQPGMPHPGGQQPGMPFQPGQQPGMPLQPGQQPGMPLQPGQHPGMPQQPGMPGPGQQPGGQYPGQQPGGQYPGPQQPGQVSPGGHSYHPAFYPNAPGAPSSNSTHNTHRHYKKKSGAQSMMSFGCLHNLILLSLIYVSQLL